MIREFVLPVAAGLMLLTQPIAQEPVAHDWEVVDAMTFGPACFDPVRGRLVQLGAAGTTHEWSRGSWLQRVIKPHDFPMGTTLASTFDTAHAEVVVMQQNGSLAAYNGENWRSLPLPRDHQPMAMAYDPVRSRLVLRAIATSTPSTWEYDGNNWVRVATAQQPPTSVFGTSEPIWFDPLTSRISMFTQPTQPGSQGTIWSYDGSNWSAQAFGTPPFRGLAAIGFDPVRGRLVLAGGMLLVGGPALRTDVWEWDGSSWVQASSNAAPLLTSSPLWFDPEANKLLAIDLLGEMRSWDGVAWSTQPTKVWPKASAGVALDVATGSLLVVDRAATWQRRSNEWDLVSTQATGIERIAQSGGTILGVGTGTFPGDPPGAWIWAGVWVGLPANNPPPPRSQFGLAFDAARGRAVMFGGNNLLGVSVDDTYEWDGQAWSLVQATPRPSPRYLPRMVFDPTKSRTVLVGGLRRVAGQIIEQGDTWSFDGNGWQQINFAPFASTGLGPAAMTFDLAFDPTVQSVVAVSVVGNTVQSHELWNDVWELRSQQTAATSIDTLTAAIAIEAQGTALLSDGYSLRRFTNRPSVATVLGVGCGGPLRLRPRTWPRAGEQDFGFELHGLPGGAVVGLGTIPASVALGGGCNAYLGQLDLVVGAILDPAGHGDLVVPVPDVPVLHGLSLFAQAAHLDAHSPIGVALSPQLALVIGD